jgi:UrcA family protein
VKVNYSDLNLATEAGSRVLYRRLVSAATHVCPEAGYILDLKQNRDAQHCIAETVARTAKEIKHPKFAQVAAAQAH